VGLDEASTAKDCPSLRALCEAPARSEVEATGIGNADTTAWIEVAKHSEGAKHSEEAFFAVRTTVSVCYVHGNTPVHLSLGPLPDHRI
jgi:hypothetical protein